MNNIISEYLFSYTEHPDPRYAIMLKGKWGCGKSFFIDNWLNQYAVKYNEGEQTLQPIYVSLYGLKSVEQITKAIDRKLNPYLYSKGAEFTKKLFKIAGQIAFRTAIDWNKDGEDDISFDATLDSLSILTSKDDIIEGSKVIVFDDLERCMMDMKLLLGFINTFVEHGACHVIIVGDETHATDSAKKMLLEFKEKTIGREFEIQPDTASAVHYFLNDDVPMPDWLKDQESFIIDLFIETHCDNLRLLRQCLYDFSTLYKEIENDLLEKDNKLLTNLLGSYIVIYCEYRGEYHDLLRDWSESYMCGLTGNETTKSRISNLQKKYRSISEKYMCNLLNSDHIKNIVQEIDTGKSIKNYAENLLRESQRILTKQDKLECFYDLPGDTFTLECDSLVKDIYQRNIKGLYLLGRTISLMAFFDKENIYWMPQAAISILKIQIVEAFRSITDKDKLFFARNTFQQGCNSFMQLYDTPIGKDICDYVNAEFSKIESSLQNKMEIELNKLSESNISVLKTLSNESIPGHQCNYCLTSVFKNIDSKTFCERIKHLSNRSLRELSEFFYIHYQFGVFLGPGCNRYNDDLNTLLGIKSRLTTEFASRRGLDKYVSNSFLNYLDGAIKRAQGDNSSLTIDRIYTK